MPSLDDFVKGSKSVLTLSILLLGFFASMPFLAIGHAQTNSTSAGIRAGVHWSRTYGSGDVFQIEQTSDGGYVAAGANYYIARLLKLDPLGNIVWQKQYATGNPANLFSLTSVKQTSDGSYIAAGGVFLSTTMTWIVKTDPTGNVIWSKTYVPGYVNSVEQTNDGGYVIVGQMFGSAGGAWAAKLDASGKVTWQNVYSASAALHSGQQTVDGGYVMAGDLFFNGCCQAWVLKLNQYGNVTWQRAYRETVGITVANSVRQTTEGGYAVAGQSPNGGLWLFKLDPSGNIVWQKDYPGTSGLGGNSLDMTRDGDFIVAGWDGAGLALRLNSTGDIVWSKSLGGNGGDIFYSVEATRDGGYVLAGHDFSFGSPNGDVWVVKLNSQGHCCSTVTENGFTITEEATRATGIATAITPVATNIPATTINVFAESTTYPVLSQCRPTESH